jgi:type VI secretion system protein ImpG
VPPALLWRDADSVQPLGLGADEALLPDSLRAFSGHRLLQETAALPQRLLFFEVQDLRPRLATIDGDEVDVVLLFARGDAGLEPLVDSASVALHCTPAINLFPRRLDRVSLSGNQHEYHLVPDRTRPMDLEVHSLETVVGHGDEGTRDFKALYAQHHAAPAEDHGYFTLRREPRRASDRQKAQGARVPSYMGEEVFISLADAHHGPYRPSLRQLSVSAWVSNRDLPVLLPASGASSNNSGSSDRAWQLDVPGPVTGVDCLRGPTRPVSRRPLGDVGWKLVNQLTQNHLALGDNAEHAAASLRDTLRLYGPPQDTAWLHMAEGLRSLHAKPVVRRLPVAGPLSFGSGTELTLEVDEHSFQGSSAFLLGTVLDVFFARHANINSFTQLTLRSVQRGVIKAWPPRLGLRQVV